MNVLSPKNPAVDPVNPLLFSRRANEWESRGGMDYVVIDHLESLEPFFLGLVTVSNQWFFCSSHGSLTAGRESPEMALFPYLTVDKIHENWNVTGPQTAISCGKTLWHPFWPVSAHGHSVRRRLLKSVLGDELVFEEWHEELALRLEYRWQVSGKFGFVRKVKITNEGEKERTFRLIDGWQDLQAAGVGSGLHLALSCLADAYRTSELAAGGHLMVHRLASGIVDAPIPLESLRATTVWIAGLDEGLRFLTRSEADRYLLGRSETGGGSRVRGERGAFFVGADLTLKGGENREWMMVGEVNQNHRAVSRLDMALQDIGTLRRELESDLGRGRERLRDLVSSVDGFQQSGDRDVTLHHYHNTLCNLLRGGLPENGSMLERDALVRYVEQNNRMVLAAHRDWFDSLPAVMNRVQLMELAEKKGDLDVTRLVGEYLPLVLGRRHGDPSRPWNKFKIRLEDEEGRPAHHYEGNWRDIFQNWEALAWSYPAFLDGFISRFLNASTIDGFNPYRLTSQGVDWEVPERDDPWVSIGYWGDHQIIYLLKFLELKEKLGATGKQWKWNDRRFVFADVPYLLDGWEETLADPRDTVVFDEERHRELMARKAKMGGDGLLLRSRSGELVRATLAEKLLIPLVAKLGQLVPHGGVWMCNQKPEWNDANNALAGYGLSVVTTAYLLRYLRFLSREFERCGVAELELSQALHDALVSIGNAMADPRWRRGPEMAPRDRFDLAEKNGRAVETYRQEAGCDAAQAGIVMKVADLRVIIATFSEVLESLLRGNRRDDGLWHSYNILEVDPSARTMEIRPLSLMLEGQVAILSAGLLSGEEAVGLLEGLERSELKSKRHPTYLLYPDRDLPRFLEMNRIGEEDLNEVPFLANLAKSGDERLVYQDERKVWRFQDSLVNGYALAHALDQAGVSGEERRAIETLYEKVFQHRSFTGRSGSMFGYEGLGCVYWHMVSKLMYAAQEVVIQIFGEQGSGEWGDRAIRCYFRVQSGLGFRQTPEQFGAFPAEPYSHSQGRRGAQQPGLTGQVKEGILCRLGELGISLSEGCLAFRPRLLRRQEFADGEVTFTQARTQVVYRVSEELQEPLARVFTRNGRELSFPGGRLDPSSSRMVLYEDEAIETIEVLVPSCDLIS